MTIIRSIASVATVGVAVLGVAVGVAGPASADPPVGNYIATVMDGGIRMKVGAKQTVVLTSCGPDCVHLAKSPGSTDLHLESTACAGTYGEAESFGPCTFALDAATLGLLEQCPKFDLNVSYSLAKKD